MSLPNMHKQMMAQIVVDAWGSLGTQLQLEMLDHFGNFDKKTMPNAIRPLGLVS